MNATTLPLDALNKNKSLSRRYSTSWRVDRAPMRSSSMSASAPFPFAVPLPVASAGLLVASVVGLPGSGGFDASPGLGVGAVPALGASPAFGASLGLPGSAFAV